MSLTIECFRSEGPAVSSPFREGGEPQPLDSTQRPEGPAQIVAHLRRLGR